MEDTTGSRTAAAHIAEDTIPSFDWEDTTRSASSSSTSSSDLSEDFTCKASLAFDQWFACLTVGKQLSNYYRYGEKRGCGKHWSKLSLCMKMKLRSEESGKDLMRAFREKEQAERDARPNVLDVWTLRTTPWDGRQSDDHSPDQTENTDPATAF
ncbi:hypothetical protein GGI15_000092 [Coemansia interrupta]|uniref:Early meiotic induction protein 1 n=1 Tax=Coemansia interrupta TaxID=1126814 RepID=A0A9W8LPA2_9FUNG|nr:hypothetical protein GGI15_000092 [Coemansia interrupta]